MGWRESLIKVCGDPKGLQCGRTTEGDVLRRAKYGDGVSGAVRASERGKASNEMDKACFVPL